MKRHVIKNEKVALDRFRVRPDRTCFLLVNKVAYDGGKYKKKTLEVLSLLRPIVHDASKTAKITCFILVLHWAVDVIKVIYYIHGPVEY